MNNNYKDLLADIKKLKNEESHDLFVPSSSTTVSFSPLTVKQQKELITSGMDLNIENLSFSNLLNKIILENCKSKGTPLLTVDRPIIALQLRAHALGYNLVIKTDDNEDVTIDLKEHINSCMTESLSEEDRKFTVTTNGVTIECNTPTIQQDTKFNRELTRVMKKTNANRKSEIDPGLMIGELYVHEIVKYIATVTIGENVLDMTKGEVPIESLVTVFESLPMSVSKALTQRIKKARKPELKALEHASLPTGDTITLDSTLFVPGE